MCWGNQYIGGDSTEKLKTGGFIGVSIIASMVLLAYTEFADIEPNDVVGVVEIKKGILSWTEMFINDADVVDKQ